jgi:hypothetical protein
MSFKSRFILATLFAFAWSGLANGETPTQDSSLNSTIALLQLDVAFEKSADVSQSDLEPSSLSGPTSMDCTNPAARSNDLETCVVTIAGRSMAAMSSMSMPASLAQH